MSTTAEVRLWGRTIGAVSLEDGAAAATFEYNPAFIDSGIEVAPLMMPLSGRLYSFPALRPETFHGLPGLVADSLPDRFGNALIDAWLARAGRSPESFNAVERLCYTGTRGMGALEYRPATRLPASTSTSIEVDKLVALASEVLTHRGNLQGWLHEKGHDYENVYDRPLKEIWNGEAYVSSRRVFAFGGPKDGPVETICTVCKGRPLYLKD